MLIDEGKHITDFFSCDLHGYAMLTLGGGKEAKIDLAYYGGLNTEPFESIDLLALQQGFEVS